ncbi:MAG: FAD-dependent oxidoreductase [Deltaproteobacteria bacterium]|nr:FAD-dependent oxidoreductase [Deltaproteobacteria bacterium]
MQRNKQLANLKEGQFDILVIGGGATGAGIALDAASRGLQVALVERLDFAAGTSSRSTKLVHGGVRYLEQAMKRLDRGQYHLVKEALHERAILLKLAPHLTHPLPILTPLYKWHEIVYYHIGLKLYDLLAGRHNLKPSRFVSAKRVMEMFPMLKREGLKGAVLYYDGQFNDARMNLSIALTALKQGAVVANYVRVQNLIKNDAGKLCGVRAKDEINGVEFDIYAKAIINATGPFVDEIRKIDEPEVSPMLQVSSGIHVVLDKRFCAPDTGVLIPKTDDGRVLFLLPWLGHTLVGTTDNPAKVEVDPQASEEDVHYLLKYINRYYDLKISREDVLASWSGLRPLVSVADSKETAKLSRDHVIRVSASGLITITGGKWTTYRKMALDAVNQAIQLAQLQPARFSQTEKIPFVGAEGFHAKLPYELAEEFKLDFDIAQHLANSYGGLAREVLTSTGAYLWRRLVPGHPYLEAEILYAIREEGACHVMDILSRRMRLAFLDRKATLAVLPRVIDLVGDALGWDPKRRHKEFQIMA